jgi:hypothetical protein
MRILVACEESQAVTKEFRRLGHEAYSCDLLPASGGHPEWHIQGDVFEVLKNETKFDLVISFPPCTDLTLSGARWFSIKRGNGSQEKSIRLFFEIWKVSNLTENPIGIMNGGKYVKQWFPELHQEMLDYGFPFKPSQIVQPWMFGDIASKATCLWLNELPNLEVSNTEKPDMGYWVGPSGRRMEKWMHDIRCKDAKSGLRAKLASKTFPGIARAIAQQYSNLIQC